MPDGSSRTPKRVRSTFNTLEREKYFKNPPKDAAVVPILNEFLTPHIESFNALFSNSGLPISSEHEEKNVGLLGLALKDIDDRVVFDRISGTNEQGVGNRLRSKSLDYPSFDPLPTD